MGREVSAALVMCQVLNSVPVSICCGKLLCGVPNKSKSDVLSKFLALLGTLDNKSKVLYKNKNYFNLMMGYFTEANAAFLKKLRSSSWQARNSLFLSSVRNSAPSKRVSVCQAAYVIFFLFFFLTD